MSISALGLNLLIFLPLLGAIVIALFPQERKAAVEKLALGVGLATFVIALLLWFGLPSAGDGLNGDPLIGETNLGWITSTHRFAGGDAGFFGIAIRYHLGLDAISGPLVALTGLLVPLGVACSFASIRHRVKEYYVWLLLLTAGMFGVFAARDVLLFYIFFEFTLVPLYFLIGIWGGEDRRYAANKFFLFTFVGSVITFAGILYLAIRAAALSGSGIIDFGLIELSTVQGLTLQEQSLLFLAFFAGFAIKVPFFPLHTWLPLAHTAAPTAGSVLLAGILLKLGTYGFLRFSLPMVPAGAVAWAEIMSVLAVAGIIYGAFCCWAQSDVKKLVAYSSVSHLGFCMLGMFSLLPVGLSGSVLYMINHGLSTGALFLVVGMVYDRYHTRDMGKLGGLAAQMPIMAVFLALFTFSSIGLPGLNGFISEFTVLFAAFNSPVISSWYGVLGATGILLGAIYMLYMMGRILFGPVVEPEHGPDLEHVKTRDLNGREIAILTPLAVLCILLGVAPRIITDPLDPVLESNVMSRVRPVMVAEGYLPPTAAEFADAEEGAAEPGVDGREAVEQVEFHEVQQTVWAPPPGASTMLITMPAQASTSLGETP